MRYPKKQVAVALFIYLFIYFFMGLDKDRQSTISRPFIFHNFTLVFLIKNSLRAKLDLSLGLKSMLFVPPERL